jgi:hypothetical protein
MTSSADCRHTNCFTAANEMSNGNTTSLHKISNASSDFGRELFTLDDRSNELDDIGVADLSVSRSTRSCTCK